MSAMSALAENPELITRVFNTKEVNPEGIYSLNICQGGVFHEVIIDDFIPCHFNKFKFARFKKGVIWPILLEKAFAKVYGAYWQIGGGGNAVQAMKDITGAPTRYYNVDSLEEEKLSDICNQIKVQKLIAVTQTKSKKEEVNTKMGLIEWHYYSLIGSYKVNDPQEGKSVVLIKLRNPWGKKIWQGAWNADDDKWDHQNKRAAGYKTEEFQTGTFYIDLDCYIQNFGEIDILRNYGDDSVYTAFPIQPVQFKSEVLVYQVLVNSPGNFYISMSQPDSRKNGVNEQSYCSMMLIKPPENYNPQNKYQDLDSDTEKAKYIGGKAHHVRDVMMKAQLKKDAYLLFVSICLSSRFGLTYSRSTFQATSLSVA